MLVHTGNSPGTSWSRVNQLFLSDFPGSAFMLLRTGWRSVGAQQPQFGSPSIATLTVESSMHSEKSQQAVDLYQEFSSSAGFQQFRFVALKLLNRVDMTGTFRFVDREAIFWAFTIATIDRILAIRPSIVVFDVTPHEFSEYVIWSVARWMGVKALFFQPCPLAPVMLPRRNLDETVVPGGGTVGDSPFSNLLLDIARSRIDRLDRGLDPSYMETQKARDITVGKLRHRLLAIRASIGWLLRERFPESVDFSGHDHQHGIVTRATKIFLVRSLQANLRRRVLGLGSARVAGGNYSVYALHYEPERTSIPEGLPIDFQGDALVAARSFIPRESSLIIKEHYSQQSSALRGFLGRSPYFYDVVETLPNTDFSPATDSLSALLGGADCVFTLTGTVALEAVLRGVPVVYFGKPWWSGLPGTFQVDAVKDFDEVKVAPMPTREEAVSYLLGLVKDSMIPGVPDGSAQVGGAESLPADFAEVVASSIYLCLRRELGY